MQRRALWILLSLVMSVSCYADSGSLGDVIVKPENDMGLGARQFQHDVLDGYGGSKPSITIVDTANKFKDKLDSVSDSIKNKYDQLMGRDSSDSSSDSASDQSSGYASRAKQALGGYGLPSASGSTSRSPTSNNSAGSANQPVQSYADSQRAQCAQLAPGSREQALCDLKVTCYEDSLRQNKNMAPGQCDGSSPSPQPGDSQLQALLNAGGSQGSTGNSLDSLMQQQQQQEAAAAEAARQEQIRRQQQAAAAEAARQAAIAQQQAAQAQAQAESSSGGMELFNAFLGAAVAARRGAAIPSYSGGGSAVSSGATPTCPGNMMWNGSRCLCAIGVPPSCSPPMVPPPH